MSDLAKVSLVDQLRGQAEWENNGYGSGITINLLLSAAARIEAAQVEMPAEQASILANNIEAFLDGSEAEQVCAEAYQVVGSLLSDLGQFNTEQGQKILDNLSEQRMIHADVLPWPSFPAERVSVKLTGSPPCPVGLSEASRAWAAGWTMGQKAMLAAAKEADNGAR